MKINLLIIVAFTVVLFSNCKQKTEKHPSEKEEEVFEDKSLIDLSTIPLEDCIKKGIYYLNEVDVATYDSISTQYFHQVIDYTDTIAIETEKELEKLNYILEVDGTQHYSNQQLDSIIQKAYKLKVDLTYYEKTVIGYVFVHTFLNKQDTMSAIIIANADCSKSEAIEIKTVTEIEPSYFKQKIRNIEK